MHDAGLVCGTQKSQMSAAVCMQSMYVEQFFLGKEESKETRDITCPIKDDSQKQQAPKLGKWEIEQTGICVCHQSLHMPSGITGSQNRMLG